MKKAFFGLFVIVLLGCSKDKQLSTAEQLAKDVATIDKYLSDKGITNAMVDPSGVRVVITSNPQVTGVKPVSGNTITVKYVGKLLSDGSVFDQTTGTKTFQTVLSTSYLIPGWVYGFPYIPKGNAASIYIPSGLAYGPDGTNGIPGNANLVFDVTLVDVK